jgi:predicted membrane protein
MDFHLFDLAGFIGVVLIIVAYLLLQLEKLPSSSPRYSLLNAGGALLIIVSLIFAFNLSAFIVEAFWFLISLLGLWRALSAKRIRNLASNGNEKSRGKDVPRRASG